MYQRSGLQKGKPAAGNKLPLSFSSFSFVFSELGFAEWGNPLEKFKREQLQEMAACWGLTWQAGWSELNVLYSSRLCLCSLLPFFFLSSFVFSALLFSFSLSCPFLIPPTFALSFRFLFSPCCFPIFHFFSFSPSFFYSSHLFPPFMLLSSLCLLPTRFSFSLLFSYPFYLPLLLHTPVHLFPILLAPSTLCLFFCLFVFPSLSPPFFFFFFL